MSCYFYLIFCLLDLSCGECNVISLYFLCYSVNVLCLACLTVCELFGEKNRNILRCGCYFVVECYGGVECGWRCSVGYTMYGLPKNVCDVPVIPVCI